MYTYELNFFLHLFKIKIRKLTKVVEVRARIVIITVTFILLSHLKCTHEHTTCDKTDWYSLLIFFLFLPYILFLLYSAYQQRWRTRPVKKIFIVEHHNLSLDTHTHMSSQLSGNIAATNRHKRNRKVMMIIVVFFCSSYCSCSFI